jgi:hypothetical protein
VSISLYKHLLVIGDLDLAGLDVVRDVLGAAPVDLAAGGVCGSEDLLDGTFEVLGHGLEPHNLRNSNDLIERNALGVLDVLLLLAVTWRLLEGLDDEGRGGGDDGNGSLTILDGELHSDAKTLPVAGGFGDIFSDLCSMLALPSNVATVAACAIELGETYSWVKDQEDRSWERAQMRHQLHHRSRGGG